MHSSYTVLFKSNIKLKEMKNGRLIRVYYEFYGKSEKKHQYERYSTERVPADAVAVTDM